MFRPSKAHFAAVTAVASIFGGGTALTIAEPQPAPRAAGPSAAVVLVTTDVTIAPEQPQPDVQAPTAAELTTVLISAVSPDNPPEVRQRYVERGPEAAGVLDQISSRAGKMMRIVKPRVIDPVEFAGDEATARLQASLRGGSGPVTPLSLTFKNIDDRWVISARSVCDVASFNGFQCPPGYAG